MTEPSRPQAQDDGGVTIADGVLVKVALEALKNYRRRPGFDPDRLLHYARICRVEGVIKPYLEALL